MGSSGYTPRHGQTKARRSGTSVVAGAVRRPIVGGAIAVSLLGTVGATVAIGEPSQPSDPKPTQQESEAPRAGASFALTEADTARLADDRRTTNVSRSAVREQAKIDAQKKAQAKKAAEAKRKAEARERKKAEEAAKPVGERKFTEEQLKAIRKDPKPYAIELMRERGWSDDQWGCLDSLWIGESDWEWDATNASSGAYGIPQSLPATKMATAGDDWKTNPITQIEWGLDYIKASYGSPCEAKSFWDSKDPHWY